MSLESARSTRAVCLKKLQVNGGLHCDQLDFVINGVRLPFDYDVGNIFSVMNRSLSFYAGGGVGSLCVDGWMVDGRLF